MDIVKRMRNPKCYAYAPDQWIGFLRSQGGTMVISVPQAIVQELKLRPGMRVKMTAQRLKEGDKNDENNDGIS